MNARGRPGPTVLMAALALGLLADAFLRVTPWGLNAAAWIGSLVVAAAVLVWRRCGTWTAPEVRLLLPALVFAAGIAWRDSAVLKTLDVLVVLAVLSLPAVRVGAGRLTRAGVARLALGAVTAGVDAVVQFVPLLGADIEWRAARGWRWSGHILAAGRGMLLAAPLLLVFGGLLVAADAAFAHMAGNLLIVAPAPLVKHLLVASCWAWVAGGYLRGVALRRGTAAGVVRGPGSASLGMMEMGIVLAALDVLFLVFVIVQFRYFFGGGSLVQASTGLTYAEYARRGFFELVTVAALVLPLLLLADWLRRRERPLHDRLFRALAGAQVVLLFVIMASAVQRMRLYQQAYGLTELRLYTTVFMGWLAVVFAWFMATVLRGRRDRFAFGAMTAAFVAVAALHALNPDALIVRTNTARAAAGRSFDARYATSLSADAVPALVEALPALRSEDRCAVATDLLYQSQGETRRRRSHHHADPSLALV